jgi:hypothetical protein
MVWDLAWSYHQPYSCDVGMGSSGFGATWVIQCNAGTLTLLGLSSARSYWYTDAGGSETAYEVSLSAPLALLGPKVGGKIDLEAAERIVVTPDTESDESSTTTTRVHLTGSVVDGGEDAVSGTAMKARHISQSGNDVLAMYLPTDLWLAEDGLVAFTGSMGVRTLE